MRLHPTKAEAVANRHFKADFLHRIWPITAGPLASGDLEKPTSLTVDVLGGSRSSTVKPLTRPTPNTATGRVLNSTGTLARRSARNRRSPSPQAEWRSEREVESMEPGRRL